MPILYSVISRGSTVLAKFAECVGNFAEVTEQIISKIQMENHKLTYSHDDEFDRSRAFLFLSDIKQKFIFTYGLQVATAIAYAMNTEFSKVLAQQMAFFSKSLEIDAISRVHGQIDELKDIMVKNIDSLKDRGEKLELLVNKTENLSNNSVAFRNASRSLARKMFWRKVRFYIILGLAITLIIYGIISMACGGLTWQSCLAKK